MITEEQFSTLTQRLQTTIEEFESFRKSMTQAVTALQGSVEQLKALQQQDPTGHQQRVADLKKKKEIPSTPDVKL